MKEFSYRRDDSYGNSAYAPTCSYLVSTEEGYLALEKYIDILADFAAEIREHEPTWKKEK